MSTIILDIDGCLNSTASVIGRPGPSLHAALALEYFYFLEPNMPYLADQTIKTIDPIAVSLINRLIAEADANIILSSSHRTLFGNHGRTKQLDCLQAYLKCLGLTGKLIGITDINYGTRCQQVNKAIEDFKLESFIIIDDEASAGKGHEDNFIKCNSNSGFTAVNYYFASKIFNISHEFTP
jgi:hypothetical protein